MCGIVGLLVKKTELRDNLGRLATPILDCMGTRGPDSAGLAIFHEPLTNGHRRFALFASDRDYDWQSFHNRLVGESQKPGFSKKPGFSPPVDGSITAVENHASLISSITPDDVRNYLKQSHPELRLLSTGKAIDIYKDEGHPADIAERFRFPNLTGTHVVGHTRMATESAVSPAHAHPYTAGEDFCLVHNGSLSNPYSIRRTLERKGIAFETDNDTEAGCRFLEWRMREGDSLEQAIATSFNELDGFFTFLMATADRMVLVRDAFACKPAVVAETDDYVAVSSEFRGLAHLPDVKHANVFEPMPEQIYSWTV